MKLNEFKYYSTVLYKISKSQTEIQDAVFAKAQIGTLNLKKEQRFCLVRGVDNRQPPS